MREKSEKKPVAPSNKGSHGEKIDKNNQHAHQDKHHSDKHQDKHHAGKHHDKHHSDKTHAPKGATVNSSPANSSHPVRHRTRSFTRRDTTHSVGSVKGHSHKDHDKSSASSGGEIQPEVKYENTYKMLPDFRFLESRVKEIMVKVFQENIKDTVYEYDSMGQKCKLSSEIIKEKVKSLNMQRFKLICHVIAIQKGEQSMVVTSRCLWDQRFDNFATVTVQHGDYYIVGMVFAVYAE